MTLLLSVLQFTLWRLCDTSVVCVTVYIVEIVVKILALGPHGYFSCGWNRSVTVLGTFLIPCNNTFNLTTSPPVSSSSWLPCGPG